MSRKYKGSLASFLDTLFILSLFLLICSVVGGFVVGFIFWDPGGHGIEGRIVDGMILALLSPLYILGFGAPIVLAGAFLIWRRSKRS